MRSTITTLVGRKSAHLWGLVLFLILISSFVYLPPFLERFPSSCKQLVIVTSESWSSSNGTLSLLERTGETWDTIATEIPVFWVEMA